MFDALLKGRPYSELRFETDEQGLKIYEVEVTHEDGGKTEFNFQRANYEDRTPPSTAAQYSGSIHATYFDAGGVPMGGDHVVNYLDGKWISVL